MNKYFVTLKCDSRNPNPSNTEWSFPTIWVIKWLRTILGCGLKEAKDLCDVLRTPGEGKQVIVVNEAQLGRLLVTNTFRRALGAEHATEYHGLRDIGDYVWVSDVSQTEPKRLFDFSETNVVKAPVQQDVENDRYPF